MDDEFEFVPEQSRLWEGRYNRIPGENSVFHIKHIDGEWWPVIMWKVGGGTGTCKAVYSQGVKNLTSAVCDAKNALGGKHGGAFVINEFGQVIVPSTIYSRKRLYIGKIGRKLLFRNPFEDGALIDISDDLSCSRGNCWDKPYVGCRFHLSKYDNIYLIHENEKGMELQRPEIQDSSLINALRDVRPFGSATFIVNPYGIVLTKVRYRYDEDWMPVYVGRINKNRWFKEE